MPPYTTDSTDPGGKRQVIVAVLVLGLAVAALLLPEPYQAEAANALRYPLTPFVALQETVVDARERAGDTGRLQAQLDSLSAALVTRATLAEENRRLRELLDLSEETGPWLHPATLLRPGTQGSGSTFVVNVGHEDGVRENAPVLVRQGLLGMVLEVRRGSAMGIDWTHPDFRASAMTGDGRIFGLVEVRRGAFREEDRLVFNGAAFQTRLEDGTQVVTSGLGGVFPRGIPLGRIDGLAEAEAGWRKSYWLRPAIEPGAATHVLVGVQADEEAIPADVSELWPADTVRARFGSRVEDLRLPTTADSLLTPPETVGDAHRVRGGEVLDSLRSRPQPRARPQAPRPDTGAAPPAEQQPVRPPVTEPIQPRPTPPPPDTGGPPPGEDGGGGGDEPPPDSASAPAAHAPVRAPAP